MSSPQDLIVNSKNFDVTKVQYDPAKVDTRGGKKVKLKYNGNSLVLSIPLMFTWGVNERVDEASGRVSYDTSIVFENGKSKGITKFLESLKEFQQKIINDSCNEKCKEWFGKSKMSTEVAEAMMYPILKYPKSKETGDADLSRDPSVKLKLPFWNGKFNVELYNMEGNPVFLPPKDDNDTNVPQGDKNPVDLVPSKSYIKGLIACDGVWMAGGRFGVTWKLLQAQVCPPVNLTGTRQCHIIPDDDDDEILGHIKNQSSDGAEESKEQEQPTVNFSDGDDDDDDDDDKEADEPEPPAPKTKKKVVKRKAKTSS